MLDKLITNVKGVYVFDKRNASMIIALALANLDYSQKETEIKVPLRCGGEIKMLLMISSWQDGGGLKLIHGQGPMLAPSFETEKTS